MAEEKSLTWEGVQALSAYKDYINSFAIVAFLPMGKDTLFNPTLTKTAENVSAEAQQKIRVMTENLKYRLTLQDALYVSTPLGKLVLIPFEVFNQEYLKVSGF